MGKIVPMKPENRTEHQIDIDTVLKTVGERLRKKRKDNNDNDYVKFAEKHGFPKMTVYRIEHGKNSNLKSIILFARAVNMSLEDLFDGVK